MAVISLPDDIGPLTVVTCSVCRKRKLLDEVAVGLVDIHGHQAFTCNSHFWSGRQLINGWADFAVAQRQAKTLKTIHSGVQSEDEYGQLLY